MPECSAGPSVPDVNPSLVYPPPFNDIGALLDPEKSGTRCESVSNLSVDEKYFLLYNHVAPPAVFPSTVSHGYQCRFNQS